MSNDDFRDVKTPCPPPVLYEFPGPAGRTIPSDSKAVVPLWSRRASAEVSGQPFDPAFPCGKGLDGPGTILSHRDSSSIAFPPGPSWRVENWGRANWNNRNKSLTKKSTSPIFHPCKDRLPPSIPHGGETGTACMATVKRKVWKECPIGKIGNEFVKVKRSCSQGVNSLQDDLAFPGLLGSPAPVVHYPPRPKETRAQPLPSCGAF